MIWVIDGIYTNHACFKFFRRCLVTLFIFRNMTCGLCEGYRQRESLGSWLAKSGPHGKLWVSDIWAIITGVVWGSWPLHASQEFDKSLTQGFFSPFHQRLVNSFAVMRTPINKFLKIKSEYFSCYKTSKWHMLTVNISWGSTSATVGFGMFY